MQEVGTLLTGAARARQRVATFGIDAEVRFASAADRAAFADELARAVSALVGRYHDEFAEEGRSHRVVVGLHQIPAVPPGAVTRAGAAGPPPAAADAHRTGTATGTESEAGQESRP